MRITPLMLALVLGGCTEVYTIPPNGAAPVPTASYLTVPGVGTVPVSPPPPPGTAYGHDGLYRGDAQALNSQGALCAAFQRARDFRVRGRDVSFGPFRGRIRDDGGLTMIYGQNTVVGRFSGNAFQGVIDFQTPHCSYAMRLIRVGPA